MRSTLAAGGAPGRCHIPCPVKALPGAPAPQRSAARTPQRPCAAGCQGSVTANSPGTSTQMTAPHWPARLCQPKPHPVAAAASTAGAGGNASDREAAGAGPNSTSSDTGGSHSSLTGDGLVSSGSNTSSSSSDSGREGSRAPLRLVELPGKGRGVVATRNLSPGELLLVCRPLAHVRGPSAAPTPQQQPHQRKAGAEVQARRRDPRRRNSGAASPPDTTGTTPAAGAAATGPCGEAALVAELRRLQWGPRQAQILAFLHRGVLQLTPAGNQPGPSTASSPSHRVAVATAGNGASGGGGLALGLADLTDPWDTATDLGISVGGPATVSAETEAIVAALPAADASSGFPGAGAEPTHGSLGLTDEQLAAAVRLNAAGLPSDDVLLARLYGHPNQPFIGLWPAHAMLNHSCAPNAVAVVCGPLLTVRCCAPVPAGGEVAISYSGGLGLGPLALRRALLERNHRFRCTCVRCAAEERLPRELAQLWSDILTLASQQVQPRLMAVAASLRSSSSAATAAAATSGGSGASDGARNERGAGGSTASTAAAAVLPVLLDIRGKVAQCCGLFEETLGQLAPSSPQEALWLQATMYPMYESRARCAQLLASAAEAAAEAPAEGAVPPGEVQAKVELAARLCEEYLDALSACVRLQGAVNAGSDMHVQLAARYDTACAAHAARHPGPRSRQLAADARQRLEWALGTRYGSSMYDSPSLDTQHGSPAEAAALGAGGANTVGTGAGLGSTAPSLALLLSVLGQLQHQQQ